MFKSPQPRCSHTSAFQFAQRLVVCRPGAYRNIGLAIGASGRVDGPDDERKRAIRTDNARGRFRRGNRHRRDGGDGGLRRWRGRRPAQSPTHLVHGPTRRTFESPLTGNVHFGRTGAASNSHVSFPSTMPATAPIDSRYPNWPARTARTSSGSNEFTFVRM